MNFNVGGFSEGLKHSYQQFCKQDAEAREHSRRLLVKLKRFEAKSFDLIAQTQTAQQMKNQYERMLMQQNPLLWAQLQRNITVDVTDFSDLGPQQLSFHSSGLIFTKEMAINTSAHNSSSTSDQHSLHEEGVWPHTPSPYPAEMDQPFAKNDVKPPNYFQANNYSSPIKTVKSYYTEEQPLQRILSASPIRRKSVEVKYSKPPSSDLPHNHFTSEVVQSDDFIPASSSTPNFMSTESRAHFNSRPTHLLESDAADINSIRKNSSEDVKPLENVQEQQEVSVARPDIVTTEDVSNQIKEISIVDLNVIPGSPNANHDSHNISKQTPDEVTTQIQPDIPIKPNEVKPFRLDSESDDPSISGPLSGKNLEGEDSDSFWN